MKRVIRVVILILLVGAALNGCSSSENSADGASLRVALVARYMSDESVERFITYLQAGLPEYNNDENTISVVGISTGDSEVDPFSVMAGTTKIASMIMSGEIDVWIFDTENASRYAEGGESYRALDSLFTTEEIDSFDATPVRFSALNDEGEATGDPSEPRGVDLAAAEGIVALTGIPDPQMVIMTGAVHLEPAKVAFRFLAN